MSVTLRKNAAATGFAFAVSMLACAPSQAAMTILDGPLFLTSTGVAPNVVLTMDDSGSMRRGWVPDSFLYVQSQMDGPQFKSPTANGMYYNPEVTYFIPQPSTASTTYSTSFTNAYFNGFDTGSGTVDLSSGYAVIAQSLPKHRYTDCSGGIMTAADEFSEDCFFARHPNRDGLGGGTSGTAAYYYLYYTQTKTGAMPSGCSDSKTDDNCYLYVKVGSSDDTFAGTTAEQQQNFANWYSFYRTRVMAAISGAMTGVAAFSDDSVRFGWQTLNDCKIADSSCNGYDILHTKTFASLDSGQKASFFDWLTRMQVVGGTPLREGLDRAGHYYETTGVNGPYAAVPGSTYAPAETCRKNFHIAFTDGLWNTSSGTFIFPGANTNPDSSGTTSLPDGETYSARAPYRDVSTSLSYSNTQGLADTAFYYWAKDLDGSLDNDVKKSAIDASGDATDQYWNPKNDPATWQHMTNYIIGLGLSTALVEDCIYDPSTTPMTKDPNNPSPGCPVWSGGTFEGDYNLLLAGTRNWPRINNGANSSNEPDGHVFDLWHAAINSRGKFFNAEDPAGVTDAFKEIMDTITALAAAGGGANLTANTSETDDPNGLIFEAKFREDWSGQLIAHRISDGYSTLAACPDAPDSPTTTCWDASMRIPIPADRKIATFDGTTAVEFEDCSTNADLASELNKNSDGVVDNLCAKRLNWLRGDGEVSAATCSVSGTPSTAIATFTVQGHGFVTGDWVRISGVKTSATSLSPDFNKVFQITKLSDNSFSGELDAASCASVAGYDSGGRASYALFAEMPTKVQARDRANSVLGDIVNSDPVYAFDEDFGYGSANALDGYGTYDAYVTTKASGTPVVYVGANDGMLHAFKADLGSTDSGKELFAYVPHAVYPKLTYLTDPAYRHKFTVDGPLDVGDAYVGSAWKTFLVGGLGSGGKAVFALDVTDPTSFTKDDVQWEFSGGTHSSNLGLTYAEPQIAPIAQDTWAAIFGNGYASDAGTSGLFVVNLDTGAEVAYLSGDTKTENGLSSPLLYDKDGDKIIDVAYAGDLQGQLWKFVNTVGAGGVRTWEVGNAGKPLFQAAAGQAITSKPQLANHPSGGVLIYFGTGSYFKEEDLTDNTTQAFYAIWDDDTSAGATYEPADLQSHSIEATTTLSGYSVRVTSNESVDWSTKKGWYLQLTSSSSPSERVVSSPIVMEFVSPSVPDRILFVTNTPYDDPCDEGGTTWLMELDLVTGTATATSVFDFNGDSNYDASDLVSVAGTPRTVSGVALPDTYGLTAEPLLLKRPDGQYDKVFSGTTGVSGTADGPGQQGEPPSTPQRIYWRQIQ